MTYRKRTGRQRAMGLLFRVLGRMMVGLLRVRLVRLLLLGAMLLFGLRSCSAPDLRIGTFNIRTFGHKTDRVRLTEILSALDADVIAIQEISDVQALRALAAELSAKTSRSYQAVSSDCGGKQRLHLGFLFDKSRASLDSVREFPELREDRSGSCFDGDRTGLLGSFSSRGRLSFRSTKTHLLTVHFPAGADFEQAQNRQLSLQRALRILASLRQSGTDRLVLLGDLNTTGYVDDQYGERSAVHRQLEQAGIKPLTDDLSCSAYWRPTWRSPYLPGKLDHIFATGSLKTAAAPSVQGFCATLGCQPSTRVPPDFDAVSDHCPVVVTVH